MNPILQALHRQLVVSCQASPGDPMENTETLRRVALSALLGGGKGLRVNGPEDIAAMRRDTTVPIIGIQKSYRGGQLRITSDFASAAALAAAGANIIALDCTDRRHAHGESWREILRRIHEELDLMVMADIATLREGIAAAEAGADMIGTTLCGYTSETSHVHRFSPALVSALCAQTGRPVVAEGHIATPEQARSALEAGAWCVVVGSAITRPGSIVSGFVRAMEPPYAVAARGSERYAIGVDIGGTFVKTAVVSETGDVQWPGSVPTKAALGSPGIADALTRAVNEVLDRAKQAGLEPCGIGIASAGAIDSEAGRVFAATDNLPGWAGFDIREHVQKTSPLPVFVENDAHAAALAELHFGAGKDLSSFVAVTIGTGIGGGVIVEKKLLRGQNGFAGTIGHQTIEFNGRPCNCGRRGCLEAYVSTEALVYEYSRLETAELVNEGLAEAARTIAERASAGESSARAAFSALASYLAQGMANVFNILDPEAIFLSGGLIQGQPFFVEEVQANVEKLLHFGAKRRPRILLSHAGIYAGVQGAAATVFLQTMRFGRS